MVDSYNSDIYLSSNGACKINVPKECHKTAKQYSKGFRHVGEIDPVHCKVREEREREGKGGLGCIGLGCWFRD
jgi:hypothetical protein